MAVVIVTLQLGCRTTSTALKRCLLAVMLECTNFTRNKHSLCVQHLSRLNTRSCGNNREYTQSKALHLINISRCTYHCTAQQQPNPNRTDRDLNEKLVKRTPIRNLITVKSQQPAINNFFQSRPIAVAHFCFPTPKSAATWTAQLALPSLLSGRITHSS